MTILFHWIVRDGHKKDPCDTIFLPVSAMHCQKILIGQFCRSNNVVHCFYMYLSNGN